MKKEKISDRVGYCTLCGIPGPTRCTPQANCLNIPLIAEQLFLPRNPKKKSI